MRKNVIRMQKKPLLLLLCVLLCLPALGACAKAGDGSYLSFKDSTGAVVNLSQKPKRVAVLFSSFAEMWTLAGGSVSISVGESVERGFCPSDTPLVDGGAGKTVNVELLVAYEPDFVICSADVAAQVDVAALLREVGIPCALFRVESFSDYLHVLDIMTRITGNREAYTQNGTDVKAAIDVILGDVPQNGGKRILFIRAGSSARATKAKTADEHFAAAMLEELGCYNIADNAPVLLDGLSMEEILREDPDYIFITTMGDAASARAYMDSLLKSEVWQSLSAVRSGAYCYLPKDLFQFKPNARWDAAYRMLWEILYGSENGEGE